LTEQAGQLVEVLQQTFAAAEQSTAFVRQHHLVGPSAKPGSLLLIILK
jgi:hypothetical protein